MQSFTKLFIVAAVASFAAAAPQLSGLPSLPVCLTGSLTGSLPAGLDVTSCAADETCTPVTDAVSIPVIGSVLGPIADELPAEVGVCM